MAQPQPWDCDGTRSGIPARIEDLTRWLSDLWDMPTLSRSVAISFSQRMTRSLGRAYPARGIVRLSDTLLADDAHLLDEVVCHELAHLTVYLRYGATAKPHGAEWRDLMRRAGYPPRARIPTARGPSSRRQRRRFRHACRSCGAERIARRRNPRWRCAACRAAGKSGMLEIHAVR